MLRGGRFDVDFGTHWSRPLAKKSNEKSNFPMRELAEANAYHIYRFHRHKSDAVCAAQQVAEMLTRIVQVRIAEQHVFAPCY